MRTTGILRVQVVEESKTEAFLTANVDNPEARRVQMAEQMRNSKQKQLMSKKRWDLALNQAQREGEQYSGMAFSHLPE